ncbi:MAG: TIGR00730 family Rossman fold protein [Deltaproteobacteria bacterium]|nr:TIGR00730 family Rossman fold protein [Deltaproteobacteria bacterium]
MHHAKISKPPHPLKRQVPLPEQACKPEEEDKHARAKIASIISSPSYIQADQDVDFLKTEDLLAVRLQLDYFKTELSLRAQDIENTIVVFGSTRIRERASIEHEIEQVKDGPKQAGRLKILERLLEKCHHYQTARDLGKIVATAKHPEPLNNLTLVTGGGPGIMEAGNRGAHEEKARTIGFNINLPLEQFPNPYVTPELCFQFHYFAIRKFHFMNRAKALVAFPGGYGTFDELFEVLTLIQTRKSKPIPVILVGESYWKQAVNFDFLVDEGVIDPEDKELFWYAESAEEIWDGICQWYELCET